VLKSAERLRRISDIIEESVEREQRQDSPEAGLEEVLSELQRICGKGDGEIPLDRTALLIARTEYPDLDHARYLSEENSTRLEALRAEWDPDGVFHGYLTDDANGGER